ncbi:MAG: cob(I)yrinic acid a,c-diamide adenosyltransferase [bacterium]|nr:cob(I)yrinic acid a,c-diamide adenosyltransferase [bacterium]
MERTGVFIVFTGDGKGKTSAALGSVIRMIGWEKNVVYCTFFKKKSSIELKVLKKLKGCKVLTFCEKHPSFFPDISEKDFKNFFRSEWNRFLKKFFSLKKCHLVVLDEILIGVRDKLLKQTELISFLKKARQKNPKINIILTGRGYSNILFNYVDVITEMHCIKHPYPEITAIRGIDY